MPVRLALDGRDLAAPAPPRRAPASPSSSRTPHDAPGLSVSRGRRARPHARTVGAVVGPRRARPGGRRRAASRTRRSTARRPRVRDPLGRRAPAGAHRPGARAGARSCCCSTSRPTTSTCARSSRCSASLRELAASGLTVLAALHDLDLAAAYGDHVDRARRRPGRGSRAPGDVLDARAHPRRSGGSRRRCSRIRRRGGR